MLLVGSRSRGQFLSLREVPCTPGQKVRSPAPVEHGRTIMRELKDKLGDMVFRRSAKFLGDPSAWNNW